MNAKDDEKKPAAAAEKREKAAPEKKSAMKFPPGVGVGAAGPRGPQQGRPWENGTSGRPQRDAARRKGKSRKVH